jgi:aspartyl protease family protein
VPQPDPWQHPPRRQRKSSRLGLTLWLGALITLALSLWGFSELFPGGNQSWLDTANMVRLVAILAVISSGLLFIREVNLKQTVRNVLMWMGIMGVLALGFAYQEPLLQVAVRLRSGFIPSYPIQTGSRQMVISESDGGNYLVYGTINGVRIRFLIDTGASDIVLSPSDARRTGVDFDLLNFDHSYETANGIGNGAPTTVRELAVGNAHFSNVAVSINKAEMNASLLGMTFLKRFKSFSFGEGKLILKW